MKTDDAAARVLASVKYSGIDPAFVARVCGEMAVKYPHGGDAVKATKRLLHIAHECFLHKDAHKNALALLPTSTNETVETATRIMRLHASTCERLPNAGEIYGWLGQYINAESIVYDIGCGFNPFALPLLAVPPKEYAAYDISADTVNLLNTYFDALYPAYRAGLLDAVTTAPQGHADVALMLKLLPVLEQQKKGRGFALLLETDFSSAIVSFPLRSVGGKLKGMESFYSTWFEQNLPASLMIAEKHIFSNELFYVVMKNDN